MTDIVERLRRTAMKDGFGVILHQHVIQAADEIVRLREEVRKLRDDCDARRRHLFQPDEDGDLTGET